MNHDDQNIPSLEKHKLLIKSKIMHARDCKRQPDSMIYAHNDDNGDGHDDYVDHEYDQYS